MVHTPPDPSARPVALPAYGYAPASLPAAKPSSNVGWAVAALVFFWPLCIPAFIYAGRVDGAWAVGDRAGARSASQSAKNYGLAGVVVGAVLATVALLMFLLVLVVFANSGDGFSVPG